MEDGGGKGRGGMEVELSCKRNVNLAQLKFVLGLLRGR